MEQLKSMKQCLMAQVQSQMGNLQNVDTKELGEAVDMIKDLSEAIYYCTITEAMEKKGEESYDKNYYSELYYDPYMCDDYYYRDMDKMRNGRMYYSSGSSSASGSNSSRGSNSMSGNNSMNSRHYEEREYPLEMRDSREGRSPMLRKNYMESKEMHKDKASSLKNLELYMQELTKDLAEMIQDASPEEKQMLTKKISSLSAKIDQLNNA